MLDTIFYSLELKANKTHNHVFEKIQRKVKSKGATANWTVTINGQSLVIDFGDEASETFISIFHSLKPMCSKIVVDDDYSIAGEYFNSLDRLFERFTNYEKFLLAVFSEDTQRDYDIRIEEIINPGIKLRAPFPDNKCFMGNIYL